MLLLLLCWSPKLTISDYMGRVALVIRVYGPIEKSYQASDWSSF